jgi:hypothetical protein
LGLHTRASKLVCSINALCRISFDHTYTAAELVNGDLYLPSYVQSLVVVIVTKQGDNWHTQRGPCVKLKGEDHVLQQRADKARTKRGQSEDDK